MTGHPQQPTRHFVFLILGYLNLLLTIIALILPLVPATPFILLAAFFFSRSSERIHRRLRTNRFFGETIRNWEDHGIIRPAAKAMTAAIVISMLIFPLTRATIPVFIRGLIAVCGLAVIGYVLAQKSRAND